MAVYGTELILDLHHCKKLPMSRKIYREFFIGLCKAIDMEAEDLHFWDYEDDAEAYDNAPVHLKGTSAVQFIKTSNITMHALDEMKRVYLNIFSCKDFNYRDASEFCLDFFEGKCVNNTVVARI